MRIDIFADIVCPWCYIGERRLERALAMRQDLQVERHWRPFQLQPQLPAAGVAWDQFVLYKFGGARQAQALFDQVTSLGKPEGIAFDFNGIPSVPNTLDAHRLILLAAQYQREWAMVHALYAAHFEEGRDLAQPAELVSIASRAGLDDRLVRTYLEGDTGREVVASSQEAAYELGVQGVPFFLFNDRYALAGAQPVEVFLQALDLSRAEPGESGAAQ